MKARWYLVGRLLWTVVAAWLLLSVTFLGFAFTPDPNEMLVARGATFEAMNEGVTDEEEIIAAQEEAIEAYRSARDRDKPLADRYTDWVVAYATLDWGVSYTRTTDDGNPAVTAVIAERSRITLAYLIPAIVLSMLGGVAVGLFSTLNEYTVGDYLGTTTAYAALGLPNFWVAEMLVFLAGEHLEFFIDSWREGGLGTPENLGLLAVAGLVVGTNLLAMQARYARAQSKEYVHMGFVRTLRSTGASDWGVGRHVLRNASIPLLSLLFTEVLVMVMITVFIVEVVLGVPGVGALAYGAIQSRDLGLVLGTTMLPIFVALAGNLLQDVAYALLDPRISHDG